MIKHAGTLLLASLMLALVFAAGPASAQQDGPQQNEENKIVTVGSTIKKRAVAVKTRPGEECKSREYERWAKNLIGRKLIRYHQTVTWCWNRQRITFAKRRNYAETPGFAWDFKGHQDRYRDSSRDPGRWFRFVAIGKFSLCGGGFCVQNKFFRVRQTVFRGGGYKADSSG